MPGMTAWATRAEPKRFTRTASSHASRESSSNGPTGPRTPAAQTTPSIAPSSRSTRAAGFIGSNLVDRLLLEGHDVTGVDDLSTGSRRFLERAAEFKTFRLEQRDLTDPAALDGLLSQATDHVFHLAANADVRDGLK